MSESKPLFSLQAYHVTEELGFILPDPLAELPPYYKPWMEIAQQIPELVNSKELRLHIDEMPLLSTQFLQKHRELRLAHMALSAMTMGYTWQDGDENQIEKLPLNLAVPYWEISQRLGLPPILIHTSVVLANWKKKDPQGPFSYENLEMLIRLPGGESAQGFFMVTLMVEVAGILGIKNIPAVINGVQNGDTETVAKALEVISQSIQDMTEAVKLLHVHVDPEVFYGELRIFLSGWKDNPCMPKGLIYEGVQAEPMEFSGGSAAQSALLHCFDELLGVEHEEKSGAFLMRMRNYMLPAHKQLIEEISSQPPLKTFVQQQDSQRLSQAFQDCVTKLVAFRNYHINIVSRFIIVPAARARQVRAQGRGAEEDIISRAPTALEEVGTGGSSIMSFLKTIRDHTKDVRLPESS